MADTPSTSIPTPPPEPTPTGTAGLLSVFLRFVDRLNNERLLLLVVVCAFGYLTMSNIRNTQEDKAFQARQSEESRLQDRRHCDDREDKIRKDREVELEKMRTWYASMTESARRTELEQRDKDRMVLTEYARIIAKWHPQPMP